MKISKKTIYAILIIIALSGGFFAFSFAFGKNYMNTGKASLSFSPKSIILPDSASADEVYAMFLCPCCGQPLDPKKVCCGMAQDMINYINSLLSSRISKDEVVIKTAQKYGINSVIESKRSLVRT